MGWSIEEAESYAAGLEEAIEGLHDELNELREIQALTVERAERAETTLEAVYEDLGEQYRRAEQAETQVQQLTWQRERLTEMAHEIEERAEKAEEDNRYLDRNLRHAREDYEALNSAYDVLDNEYADLFRRFEAAEELVKQGSSEINAWMDTAERLQERLEGAEFERYQNYEFAVELNVRAKKAETRASSWLEAAKEFCRLYHLYTEKAAAAWQRENRLDLELWELKAALRTLGGDRD